MECYLKKSLINIKYKNKIDTFEITRYYTNDSIWHIQEYIVVSNNKIIYPSIALYCDFSEDEKYYKLSFISDESRFSKPNLIIDSLISVSINLNGRLIKSNNNTLLVPKDIFSGIVKIEKETKVRFNEKHDTLKGSIYIDTEIIKKYGNLLNQFLSIKKNCPEYFNFK